MAKYNPSQASKRWMLYVILVALIAWAGWGVVIYQLPANDLTKPMLFTLLFVSTSATLMPAIAYLNTRFGRIRDQRVYQARFVRQSILSGAFTVMIAWLQMQRVLSVTLGLILLAVFVLTETFLITRETPAQKP